VWIDPEYGVVRFIRRERQEAFVDGKVLVLIVVRAVAVNTDLPDALFDPAGLRQER